MTSRRRAMSNERWNNVAYSNIGIYDVEQRQNNVVYLNFDINNVRQRRNNAVFFQVEFHKVDQRRKNIVKMAIFKRMKRAKKLFFWASKKMNHLINNTCFWLWSIKMKGKHGTYNVKTNVGKYNAWYMKRKWKSMSLLMAK